MDVDTVPRVVIGCDGDGILGISGICDGRVGIRTEKISLIRDETPYRKPEMKGFPDVQRVPDQDPPDPGHRSFKAHEDKLAPGAHVGDLGVDSDLSLLQKKGQRVLAPERNGNLFCNLPGGLDKTHRVDTNLICPQFHGKSRFLFPHTKFRCDLIRIGIHDCLKVVSRSCFISCGGDDGGTI